MLSTIDLIKVNMPALIDETIPNKGVIKGANKLLRGILLYNYDAVAFGSYDSTDPIPEIFLSTNEILCYYVKNSITTLQGVYNKINSMEQDLSLDFVYLAYQFNTKPNTSTYDIDAAIQEKFPNACVIDACTYKLGSTGRKCYLPITRFHLRTHCYHMLDTTVLADDLDVNQKGAISFLYMLTLAQTLNIGYGLRNSNSSIDIVKYQGGQSTYAVTLQMNVDSTGLITLYFNSNSSANNQVITTTVLGQRTSNAFYASKILYGWVGTLKSGTNSVTNSNYNSDFETLYVSTNGSLRGYAYSNDVIVGGIDSSQHIFLPGISLTDLP